MLKMFARAAESLLNDRPEGVAAPEIRHLLEALGYVSQVSADGIDSDALHRARLLKAASLFKRVFQLASPDAPGLVSFGAELDPALAGPQHAGGPTVSVSGVGLSAQEAFQGCVGEGIEYLSQLHSESDILLPSGIDSAMARLATPARELVATLSARRSRSDTGLSWHRATRLNDGCEVLLPADLCLRRSPAQRDFTPPFRLSTGSAAGTSWEAAAIHGLLELIERDAASLWWRGGQRGRSIPAQDEANLMAEALLTQLRQDNPAQRRNWLLDITTDIGVPCVAAVSSRPDGFGFAFGLAARPTLKAAARSAILEMCQIELAHAVVEAKCVERGTAALNAADRIHLRRATMINADRCSLLQPVPERGEHLAIDAADSRSALMLIARRLQDFGIETFGLDLTRPRFAVPVARAIAPGLQQEPSEIVTARLSETITRTGGGTSYTGGVALI
jgi:ribosomal protein S12 methylthiotransferase accessory factor